MPHVLELTPQANFIEPCSRRRPTPNQPAPPQPVLREATIVNAEEATFFDVGLDDARSFDDGITAARKCVLHGLSRHQLPGWWPLIVACGPDHPHDPAAPKPARRGEPLVDLPAPSRT